MSNYICDVGNDKVVLEVYECECGLHLGMDSTYLIETEGIVKVGCPACGETLICGSAGKEDLDE